MLLGFKTQVNDKPTGFVEKILGGMPRNHRMSRGRDFAHYESIYQRAVSDYLLRPKLHTIRQDDDGRWQPGKTIHYATGVRSRTQPLRMFAVGECVSVQDIAFRIGSGPERLLIAVEDPKFRAWDERWRVLTPEQEVQFALNDGFDTWEEFDAWFRPLVVAEGGRLDRKLIHWTDLTY